MSAPDLSREFLQCAVRNDGEGIRKFVQFGVPPTFANGIGQTALHIASLWGSVDVVKVLLELGADYNAQNRLMGSTPLHSASSGRGDVKKRAECIKLLLAAKAHPGKGDHDGVKPIDTADCDLIREALGGAQLLLHQAVEAKSEQLLSQTLALVKSGGCPVSMEDLNLQGVTALHFAVVHGWRTGLDMLLKAGASPSAEAASGETPVHTAVRIGDITALKLLLDSKADVDAQDVDLEAHQRFSSKTMDINIGRNQTALHCAAALGNVVALKMLVDAGAQLSINDATQFTPLHRAIESSADAQLGLGVGVRIVGGDSEKNGLLGAITGKAVRVDDLCAYPVLVHGNDRHIIKAENLQSLHNEAVFLLLEAKADANCFDDVAGRSRNHLHEAARLGDTRVVEMLVQARAAVDHQDKQGFCALHMAARSRQLNVARLLVDAGASCAMQTNTGQTAVDLAKKNGAPASMIALLTGSTEEARDIAVRGREDKRCLSDFSPAERCALFLD